MSFQTTNKETKRSCSNWLIAIYRQKFMQSCKEWSKRTNQSPYDENVHDSFCCFKKTVQSTSTYYNCNDYEEEVLQWRKMQNGDAPFIPWRVWWSWNKTCEYALPCNKKYIVSAPRYRLRLQPPRMVSMKRRGKDKDKSKKPLWAERIKAEKNTIIHS